MSRLRTIYSLHVALCREASAVNFVYLATTLHTSNRWIKGFAYRDANQKKKTIPTELKDKA